MGDVFITGNAVPESYTQDVHLQDDSQYVRKGPKPVSCHEASAVEVHSGSPAKRVHLQLGSQRVREGQASVGSDTPPGKDAASRRPARRGRVQLGLRSTRKEEATTTGRTTSAEAGSTHVDGGASTLGESALASREPTKAGPSAGGTADNGSQSSQGSQDEAGAVPSSSRQHRPYYAESRNPELELVRALGRVTAHLSPRPPTAETNKDNKVSKDSSRAGAVHYRLDGDDSDEERHASEGSTDTGATSHLATTGLFERRPRTRSRQPPAAWITPKEDSQGDHGDGAEDSDRPR